MLRVISFSLWGNNPKYTVGAIKNAELAKSIYPGWTTFFYTAVSVPPQIKNALKNLGAHVIEMDYPGDWTSTFWRFEPISYQNVEIMISRDTDSRLSEREKAAVDDWISSPCLFHVMRDHPAHSVPILAGMWGAKKPILGDMQHLIKAYSNADSKVKQSDQIFLRDVVWPRVSYTTLTHDEFFSKQPFPSLRIGGDFVGQVFDENDNYDETFRQSLLESIQ